MVMMPSDIINEYTSPSNSQIRICGYVAYGAVPKCIAGIPLVVKNECISMLAIIITQYY
jgi:hypothetical protein